MSDWECKELIYELKSPVHIGNGQKLGIINRTRYYIPGKTMWGAAVAKIGKELGLDTTENKKWGNLGEFVKENMKFTYFFISDKKGNEVKIPKYTENGNIKYGNLSEKDFESKYITSFASAAVEKEKGTATDGDLHEIELIKNRTGPKEDDKVYINGYVFIDKDKFEKEDYDKEDFLKWIEELQIGGERNYGYGKIKRDKKKNTPEEVFGNEWKTDSEDIVIEKEENKEFTPFGHILIEDEDNSHINEIRGDLEPLIGREYSGSEGQNAKFSGIALAPGSENPFSNNEFVIDKYGFIRKK